MLLVEDHVSVLGDFVFWDKGVGPNFQIKSVAQKPRICDWYLQRTEGKKVTWALSILYVVCIVLQMYDVLTFDRQRY